MHQHCCEPPQRRADKGLTHIMLCAALRPRAVLCCAVQARHYRSYLYHEVPATWLEWHHRRAAILSELAFLLPDVICLQEVDRYEDLEAELQQLG